MINQEQGQQRNQGQGQGAGAGETLILCCSCLLHVPPFCRLPQKVSVINRRTPYRRATFEANVLNLVLTRRNTDKSPENGICRFWHAHCQKVGRREEHEEAFNQLYLLVGSYFRGNSGCGANASTQEQLYRI